MEDIPSRDQRLLDTKPKSKTSTESDAEYTSSCQEDVDDSAIKLVWVSLPPKHIHCQERTTASSGYSFIIFDYDIEL